jgi:hypothetical protein
MGSPGVAAWIACVAFWSRLFYGWTIAALDSKRVAGFLFLWLAGRVGLPYFPYEPVAAMFSSFVAILDVALVFTIFKGDVRLT